MQPVSNSSKACNFIPQSTSGKVVFGVVALSVAAIAAYAYRFFSESPVTQETRSKGAYASCKGAVATNGGSVTATAIGARANANADGAIANGVSYAVTSVGSNGTTRINSGGNAVANCDGAKASNGGSVTSVAVGDGVSPEKLAAVLGMVNR